MAPLPYPIPSLTDTDVWVKVGLGLATIVAGRRFLAHRARSSLNDEYDRRGKRKVDQRDRQWAETKTGILGLPVDAGRRLGVTSSTIGTHPHFVAWFPFLLHDLPPILSSISQNSMTPVLKIEAQCASAIRTVHYCQSPPPAKWGTQNVLNVPPKAVLLR